MKNDKLFKALNDINLFISRLKFINNVSVTYVINSQENESKLDLSNAVNTFSDCIEKNLARLEAATAEAWEGYHEKIHGATNEKLQQLKKSNKLEN